MIKGGDIMSEIETPMCPNCDDAHLCECESDYGEGDACYECPECEEIFYEVDGELMPEEEYDSRNDMSWAHPNESYEEFCEHEDFEIDD
jgi:hypothetical protein